MADLSWLVPWLATGGGIRTRGDVAELVEAGVTHVVNCSDEDSMAQDEGELCRLSGLRYVHNPAADDGRPKPLEWFDRTMMFLDVARVGPGSMFGVNRKRKALVHCSMGVNRGPSNAYAVLRMRGYPAAYAEELIRKARPFLCGVAGLAYVEDAERYVRSRKELG